MKKKFHNNPKTDSKKYRAKNKFTADARSSSVASDSRECMGSRENDPSWYAINPQLLKDAASFPYAWPLGNRLNVGKFGVDINKGSLPGIMAMNWVPTFGNALDATSPINVASVNVYTKVRHDNSGHANYDHADYMLYLMAMDSVYAFHAWMRRAYGAALTYSNVNRYFPRAALRAMGVDFDDIQRHLADFRHYINLYAVKASALAIPASMSIMTKHYWMSEGMYFDSNQDKPQTYVFNPLGFYQFDVAGDPAVGQLNFLPLFGSITDEYGVDTPKTGVSAPKTFAEIIAYGDSLLAPIISDEDFGIMSGDTLKSFGVGGCYTLPSTEETYTVLPSYVPEVLDQIQNATFIGLPNVESLQVTQDTEIGPGGLRTHPKFTHPWMWGNVSELPGQNAFLVDRFVTFEHGDITPANTMEATRWTNIGTEVLETGTRDYYVPTIGTEVMCSGSILWFAVSSASGELELTFTDGIYVSMNYDLLNTGAEAYNFTSVDAAQSAISNIAYTIAQQMRPMNRLIQQVGVFDRHPALYITGFYGFNREVSFYPQNSDKLTTHRLTAAQYAPICGALFDVNYYTILSSTDLEEMSHIALLSEFDVTARK